MLTRKNIYNVSKEVHIDTSARYHQQEKARSTPLCYVIMLDLCSFSWTALPLQPIDVHYED